jgi:hypothetical protein
MGRLKPAKNGTVDLNTVNKQRTKKNGSSRRWCVPFHFGGYFVSFLQR